MSIFDWYKFYFTKNTNDDKSGHLILPLANIKAFAKKRSNRAQYICNAPFTSLRFERYGRVLVCCHNNSFIAGIYPRQSLTEILNSSPIKRFRYNVIKNKLDSGCRICYDNIMSENYNSVSAQMFDNYTIKPGFPTMLDFKIDNTCNLNCVMCFSVSTCQKQSSGFDKNLAFESYNDNFIKELEPFIPHLKNARFSGGEPFLSKYYFKIWQKIHSLNPQCVITVQTNGNVMTKRIKEILAKGNFSINVSFDSLDAETYKNIRVNGSLDKVLENISFFRDYCEDKKTKFGITICPMRVNANELHDLISFCNRNNAYAWFSIVWYPVKMALWSLDAKGLSTIYNNLKNKELPEITTTEKYNKAIYDEFVNTLKSWHTWALGKGIEETVSLSSYRVLVMNAIEKHFDKIHVHNQDEINTRKSVYLLKANNIINKCTYFKISRSAMNLLFKYNSKEMFLEILEEENENDIIENLKALSL